MTSGTAKLASRSILVAAFVAGCANANHPGTVAPAPAPMATLPAARVAPPRTTSTASELPVVARVENVADDYFGTKLVDPYRWMERPNNPELTTWLRAQGRFTNDALSKIAGRDKLLHRIRELGRSTSFATDLVRSLDRLFYLKLERDGNLKSLVVREGDRGERVLVDAEALSKAGGAHVSIDNFAPSNDGTLVAYGLAEGGGEISTIHVIDTATHALLADSIERVWGEFSVAWMPDGKSFVYVQMARAGFDDPSVDKFLNMRAYLHRLGQPTSSDVPLLGADVNAGALIDANEFPIVEAPTESRWVLGLGMGAHNQQRVYVAPLKELRGAKTAWRSVAQIADDVGDAVVHHDALYLLSRKNAPNGRVLRLPLNGLATIASADVVLPEGDDVIRQIVDARDGLYVAGMRDGQSTLRKIDYATARAVEIPMPWGGSIQEIASDARRPGAIIALQGWTHPGEFIAYEPSTGKFRSTGVGDVTAADFANISAERVEAKSVDGTLVPLTILRRTDIARDGARPTILFGYGAYGNSIDPSFRPTLLAWLERGGIWAVAHVRGGGEKGDRWRIGGTGPNKPNAVHDFTACAEYLIREGYTSRAHLAAHTASMGGVLVGRAITERPELFAAAAIEVGEVNVLRYLQMTNGANQELELGRLDTEAGFRALLAMDAYQNVREGGAYPAVILSTGLNDQRVPPWTTAKLGARLQSASRSGKPVLVRVDDESGHGVGSTREQRYILVADLWSFMLQQTGDPEFQPTAR